VIGLAVPDRPIGPWPRRTGAPQASATRRDRNPMLTRLLTGRATTPRDERVQDGTTLRHPPSSTAWWSPGAHQEAHRVRNLGPGVRLPRALRALAPHEAVVPEGGPHPPVEAEPTAPRYARVILVGRATSVPVTAVLNGPERTTTKHPRPAPFPVLASDSSDRTGFGSKGVAANFNVRQLP
jgi:hypothetical protein